MTEAKACTSFQFKHETLKDILELLGKLHNTESTKKNVFNHLKGDLGTYCSASYLNDFYGDRGGSSYGGTIQLLTDAGKRISEAILQTTPWASRHVDPHADHSGKDCGEKYSEALQACLPKTFPALFFLFFNVSNDCKGIGGGKWSEEKVNGSGQNLNKWLIGDSSDDFIARKFSKEELHDSKTGKNVADPLKKAVSLKPDTDAGSLQNVLCGFMFVCEWHDALTGHACLFLYKFCSKVSQDSESLLQKPYKDHSGAFKEVCSALKSDLTPFIVGSSGLSAVSHGNTNLFDSLWDNDKFLTYCTWLKGNIYRIVQSLKNMPMESSQWSSDHLMSGSSAGPFKYGFVFKASSWTSSSTSKSKLQDCISKLIDSDSGSLGKLKSFLENPSTPSSAGATAGGVFTGLFGLGGAGAGAAYATNAFGFQNLVTSFISSFLK